MQGENKAQIAKGSLLFSRIQNSEEKDSAGKKKGRDAGTVIVKNSENGFLSLFFFRAFPGIPRALW